MSGHTPGPWTVELSEAPVGCPLAWIAAGHGDQYTGIAAITLGPAEANAARIVACVNALEGLDPAAVADVVAALENIAAPAYVPLDQLPDYDQPNGWRDVATSRIDIARTALARIRGEG